MVTTKILVAETDYSHAEILKMHLTSEGYEVKIVTDGVDAIDALYSFAPNLVVLDIALPKRDTQKMCREMKSNGVKDIILMLSKNEYLAKVHEYEVDDFVVKPFDFRELVTRVNLALHHVTTSTVKDTETIRYENLEISLQRFELVIAGQLVNAPPKEMVLLYFLASNPNRVFTRDQLLDKVWGFDYLGDSRTVDVHVKRLREKLKGLSKKWQLRTVWGVGYKFEVLN